MDVKITILIFLVLIAFFAVCLLALRRAMGYLIRFIFEFWSHTGVLGAKDGSMDNPRINGFVLVGSVAFLLLGAFGIVILGGGYQYFMLKWFALVIVVILIAPLIAKYFGRRKRK